VERARLIIEVSAGIIPGTPMDEYTKRFALTEAEWQDALGEYAAKQAAGDTVTPPVQAAVLAELNGRANGYAQYLMMQPDYVNWVRTEWVWL
jgi:hypothetical protein